MKNSIIKEIYLGNRGSYDTIKVERTKEYQRNSETVAECFEQMEKEFSHEHFSLFKKFEAALQKTFSAETDAFYIEGFKVGLLIGIECAE